MVGFLSLTLHGSLLLSYYDTVVRTIYIYILCVCVLLFCDVIFISFCVFSLDTTQLVK